ncbi:MAG: ABC transporter ATP-binding protein [Pseudohongiellaceae bacterium]
MSQFTPGGLPLAVTNLEKSYGRHEVIRGLNLEVQAQAILGLVGLNGSGKTTTLECVLGLQGFQGGDIHVLGLSPTELYRARGDIVGIFDTPSLHPNLTVRQSLEHARLLCQEPVRHSAEVEVLLGIERYRDFKIKHLSLGNRRRASIAQGLLGRPALIVLDEPFNGLDAEGVDDVLALIGRLNRDEGTTFLLSSHQLPYLEQICSHLAILDHGVIALSDEIGHLLAQQHSQVRVRCNDPSAAVALIEETGVAAYERTDEDGFLHFSLTATSSEALNSMLVSQGIEVSELVIHRPSLSSLFRSITGGQG